MYPVILLRYILHLSHVSQNQEPSTSVVASHASSSVVWLELNIIIVCGEECAESVDILRWSLTS